MRIPFLDMEMNLDGLVKARDDGDIELLPCPLTAIIAAREGLIFDGFFICVMENGTTDALLCAYTAFSEQHYIIYDILLSESEFTMLTAL